MLPAQAPRSAGYESSQIERTSRRRPTSFDSGQGDALPLPSNAPAKRENEEVESISQGPVKRQRAPAAAIAGPSTAAASLIIPDGLPMHVRRASPVELTAHLLVGERTSGLVDEPPVPEPTPRQPTTPTTQPAQLPPGFDDTPHPLARNPEDLVLYTVIHTRESPSEPRIIKSTPSLDEANIYAGRYCQDTVMDIGALLRHPFISQELDDPNWLTAASDLGNEEVRWSYSRDGRVRFIFKDHNDETTCVAVVGQIVPWYNLRDAVEQGWQAPSARPRMQATPLPPPPLFPAPFQRRYQQNEAVHPIPPSPIPQPDVLVDRFEESASYRVYIVTRDTFSGPCIISKHFSLAEANAKARSYCQKEVIEFQRRLMRQ